MKNGIIVIFVVIGFQVFSQQSSKKFDRLNAGGIGFGAFSGGSNAFGANYVTSANYFAFSLDGLFFDMDEPINDDLFKSELSAKIGVLAPIKGYSHFSFLTGIARVRGSYTDINVIKRGWLLEVKEEEVRFTTIGIPVQLEFHLALGENFGIGIRSFATYNNRTPYYGGLVYLKVTDFSK